MKMKLGAFLLSLSMGSIYCEISEELSQAIKNVVSSIQKMHVIQQKKSISKTLKLQETSTDDLQTMLLIASTQYKIKGNLIDKMGGLIENCIYSEEPFDYIQCESFSRENEALIEDRWIIGLSMLVINEELKSRK